MCSPRGNLLRAARTRYVSITRAFGSTVSSADPDRFYARSLYLYTYLEFNSTWIRVGRIEFSSIRVCTCVCIMRFFRGDVLHGRDYTVASNGCAVRLDRFQFLLSSREFDKLFYQDCVRYKIEFRNLV